MVFVFKSSDFGHQVCFVMSNLLKAVLSWFSCLKSTVLSWIRDFIKIFRCLYLKVCSRRLFSLKVVFSGTKSQILCKIFCFLYLKVVLSWFLCLKVVFSDTRYEMLYKIFSFFYLKVVFSWFFKAVSSNDQVYDFIENLSFFVFKSNIFMVFMLFSGHQIWDFIKIFRFRT